MKNDNIIRTAVVAHKQYWRATSNESEGDRQATNVTKAWQQNVESPRIKCEVPIGDNLKEKIDVVDLSTAIAYELKVSGKNPQHEFYKDIFKVVVYNQNNKEKIKSLVFLTEQVGTDKLNRGLGKAVTNSSKQLGINIYVIGI